MNSFKVVASKPRVEFIEVTTAKDSNQSGVSSMELRNKFKNDNHINKTNLELVRKMQNEPILAEERETSPMLEELVETVDSDKKNKKEAANWYRNAVFCMLETYIALKTRINSKSKKSAAGIWEEVSNVMRRSYFYFSPLQCQFKWSFLRRVYLHVRNLQDIEKLEYFDVLHAYYKDLRVENILRKAATRADNEDRITSDDYTVDRKNSQTVSTKQIDSVCTDNQPIRKNNDEKSLNDEYEMENDYDDEIDQNSDENEYQPSLPSKLDRSKKSAIKILLPVGNSSEILTKTQEKKFTLVSKTIEQQINFNEAHRRRRHREKILLYQEYNNKLLEQQKRAFNVQKELMEKLINCL